MPTFLVTRKMDPALAARVEASVTGRRKTEGVKSTRRVVAVARFAVIAVIVGVVCSVAYVRRRDRLELEHARAALLGDVRAKSAGLTPYDLGYMARAETWLTRFAGTYEGDVIADELKAPGALGETLARPTVYVRGPLSAFASASGIAGAAAASGKDPLALCLVDPPATRTEKALMTKVRAAYSTVLLEQPTPNMRRLREVDVGLPVLLPAWAARVEAAQEPEELDKLRGELEKAPVEAAKRGVKASLLLFAMDEPGDGKGPTELDGERAHGVRIGLVDMVAEKVLLRLRRSVDPAWISTAKRAEFASGLDGCALAMDVRDAASGGTGVKCEK